MLLNYFFIDGSALTAQIRALRRHDKSYKDRKLDPLLLIKYFSENIDDMMAHEFKRATFYFPKGDEVAIEEYLIVPDFKKPGVVRDIAFEFCGQKLKNPPHLTLG
jgi:hypothetical protein